MISAIHRGHVLPKRINDGDKCQRHFLEASNSIIAKVSVYLSIDAFIQSVLQYYLV